jgi:hypothetical protein
MASKFKRGDEVKLITVVPQGPVLSIKMDEDGNILYLIEWVSQDGVTEQRWFLEEQLSAA